MKAFDTNKIKNVVLLGHQGSGKTTLAEAMLFEAGETTRRGTVEGQNTVSDYHEIEQKRGNSMFATLLHLNWKEDKVNIIDTPGFDDFIGEVISSLRVADLGVMVLNAQNGVEVGTEIIWEYIQKFLTPTVFVINQLDNDKANFDDTVEQAKSRFGNNVTVVQFPYNSGTDFNGIVDVLKMVMYQFPDDGGRPEKVEIPAEVRGRAEDLHNELIEAIAVNDESLMELYFEQGELTENEMAKGLKKAIVQQDIFPLFCCSAKQNMGSGRVLGFIADHGPAPHEVPAIKTIEGEKLVCDASGEPVVFVYKTAHEQNLGNLSFFKVYSGTLTSGTDLINTANSSHERINQIYTLNGKQRVNLNEMKAGDIGVTVKLKNTGSNTTLSPKHHEVVIEPIVFPSPRIRVAIDAENKADMEKLAQILHQLHGEDPTLQIEFSKELKQTLISGQGELHLQLTKWRINEQNGKLAFDYVRPKIEFRETITKSTNSVYRHKKQSGGAGQFGEVHMLIEPYYEGMPAPKDLNVRNTDEIDLPWGGKLVVNNCVVGGAIDAKYMNAITKGIQEKMEDGPLTGSYVRDVRVSVYDGKMHAVDSNDMSFKLAASQAFKNGFQDANPQLMEPVCDVEVMVTEEGMGDVMGDLQTRRAMIMGMEAAGHYQIIKAKVPLMELYKYSSTLRSLSQGRAKHRQAFAEYAAVPRDIQDRLIAEHKSSTDEE
ncbi:MAG: elongation factor G [Chitinophagales bacterium]